MVASLLSVAARHAAHICSASAVFACALQRQGATVGVRHDSRRRGDQCTASSFCGGARELAAFRAHCAALRTPPLRQLHRSVLLIGPWAGLSPAALRVRRSGLAKKGARSFGWQAAPMLLHRCCQERPPELAKEEEAWVDELLSFSKDVPKVTARHESELPGMAG